MADASTWFGIKLALPFFPGGRENSNQEDEEELYGNFPRPERCGDPLLQLATDYWTEQQTRFTEELDAMVKMYGVIEEKDEAFEIKIKAGDLKIEKHLNPKAIIDQPVRVMTKILDCWRLCIPALAVNCKRMLKTEAFQRVQCLLIMFNSVQLGLQSHDGFRGSHFFMNALFTVLFAVEMLPRFIAWAWFRGETRSPNHWLFIDAVLLLIALIDIAIQSWRGEDVYSLMALTHGRTLRFLPLLFVKSMTSGSEASEFIVMKRAVVRSMCAFGLLPMVWLPFVTTYSITIRNLAWDDELLENLTNFHSTFETSVVLTDIASSGFEDWLPKYEGLIQYRSDNVNVFACALLLASFVLVVDLVLLPSLTALAVYNWMSTAREERERIAPTERGKTIRVAALRRVLQRNDLDDNSRISNHEFALMKQNYAKALRHCGISKRNLKKLWSTLRREESGEVLVETFVLGYIKFFGQNLTVNNLCWDIALRLVGDNLGSIGHLHLVTEDLGGRIMKKLEGEEEQLRLSIAKENQDMEDIRDIFRRLDASHRALVVGMQCEDWSEAEDLYHASTENAKAISTVRVMVLRQELEETIRVATLWAANLAVDCMDVIPGSDLGVEPSPPEPFVPEPGHIVADTATAGQQGSSADGRGEMDAARADHPSHWTQGHV